MRRRLAAIALAVSSATLGARAEGMGEGTLPEIRWSRAPAFAGTGVAEALAVDPRTGRIAVGDVRGVLVGSAPGSLVRVVRRGPVRDLAFAPAAGLLVATDRGLFALDAEGRVADRSPGAGERARAVARVVAAGGLVAVATGDGVFISSDAQAWGRLDAGLPAHAASALGLRAAEGGLELWAVLAGEVWRVRLSSGAVGAGPASVRREQPFGGAVGRQAVDLLVSDDLVLVLAADALAVLEPDGWRELRPTLPAGAAAQRIARVGGRLWIATDRGLVEAPAPEGVWQRAGGAAATGAAFAVAQHGAAFLAVGEKGLLVGELAPPPREAAPAPPGAPLAEPPVDVVQRAALAYLDLRPAEIDRLRRGVRRRGWLPIVDVRLVREQRRFSGQQYDETVTSGVRWALQDRDIDRATDHELALVLSWDLGDVAYHPEEVDVSKEAREVIELRDDVLDEVNQLYFERRRVLLDLDAAAGDPSGAARLRLRADELAAGLDAWTGGWFGRALAPGSRAANPSHPSGGPS